MKFSKYDKVKVCHVVYCFELGGVESLLVELLNHFDSNKFDLHLIVLTNDRLRMVSLFKSTSIHIMDCNSLDFKSFRGFLPSIQKLSKKFKEINPDIVHNHLASANLLLVTTAMRLSGIKSKHIRTIHTTDGMYSKNKSVKDQFRLTLDKVAMMTYKPYLIGVSKLICSNNAKYFNNIILGQKLIYNGIDLDRFIKATGISSISDKHYYGLKKEDRIVSYVSRMEDGKNHEFLIDIWSEVIDEYPNATLCFAGDGSLKKMLIEKVSEKNLSNNIVFLGSVSSVEKLLALSEFAVFPSSFEGFSIVMIEKLAMGLPVIATDIEAFEEIAVDNVNALLVPLGDSAKFISSILLLLKDSEIRMRIGEQGHISASAFDIRTTALSHEKYYLDCLSRNLL